MTTDAETENVGLDEAEGRNAEEPQAEEPKEAAAEVSEDLEDEDSGTDKQASANAQGQEEDKSLAAKWSCFINKIHEPIIVFLQWMTQLAAHNPKRTMAAIVAYSLFILIVGLMTNFDVDVDEDRLWTASDSRPIQHSNWIENDSGFPTDPLNFWLFFHADGKNTLSQTDVGRVFEAFDLFQSLDNYETMCSESDYVWPITNQSSCEVEGVVHFWNLSSTIFETTVSSDEEAIADMSNRLFPDGSPVNEQSVFGKPQRDASTDLLTATLGYTVVIRLPNTKAAENYEDEALDVMLDLRDRWAAEAGNALRVEVLGDGSFGDEFERAIVTDIPLIPIVFIIMSVFTSLVFFKRDKVQSRSLLGFGAVAAVVLSLMSGFGLLFCIGTPFTSMTQILPFIIFGIGLDDAFIIFGSYSRTSPTVETTERIRQTVDDVGVSITLTSVTSALAFGLGCLSSIPAVYWLCLYAFPTIIMIYIYQLTFFISWIVLDERRIQHHKRDCCICFTVDVDTESSETTDENQGAANPDSQEDGSQQEAVDVVEMTGSRGAGTPKENFVDALMVRYAEFLFKPWVKALVILLFTVLAVFGAISASQLTQEFNFTDVMPEDSYVADFFDAFELYTSRTGVSPFAYFRFVDQADTDIQRQMDSYVSDLVEMDAVVTPPENFWLHDFRNFTGGLDDTSLTFEQQMDLFLADPVFFELYNKHIVRDDKGIVTTSRVLINFDNVDVEDVNEQIDALEEQREITARQPINQGHKDWRFFTYEGIYNIWEFYSSSVEELIFTTIMGVVSVTSVALVFVPHWTAALFTLPMICLLYVDLLGVMQWAGVHVNAVSYVSMVMSIGLLVDFIMHVLLRYYECPGNRREKTVEMLRTMGSSILIGGISTFLGTLPLAFSTSTIFFTIFITFVGLVTLGIGHGLILLPVVLSMIGPEYQVPTRRSSITEGSNKELALTERTQAEATGSKD